MLVDADLVGPEDHGAGFVSENIEGGPEVTGNFQAGDRVDVDGFRLVKRTPCVADGLVDGIGAEIGVEDRALWERVVVEFDGGGAGVVELDEADFVWVGKGEVLIFSEAAGVGRAV